MKRKSSTRPRLELINISRSFGAVRAVSGVSLQLYPGEICAVLGENGAGKSTLMNLLYGVIHPDEGSIVWNGKEVQVSDPRTATRLGIAMVFQHFSVLETLTVRENLILTLSELSPSEVERRFLELCDKHQVTFDLDLTVGQLSMGERQRLEIMRCLMRDIELLILDEPTSVLTPGEVQQLFSLLRTIADTGSSILFISHKMPEVYELCSNAVVLRRGVVAGTAELDTTEESALTEMMLGDEFEFTELPRPTREQTGLPALQIKDLSVSDPSDQGRTLKNINLQACPGDIIGIAGVAGSGQDTFMSAISGECKSIGQSIVLHEQPVGALTPRERRRVGIRTLPVNRLGHAACPDLSLVQNTLLTHYDEGEFQHRGWLSWNRVRQETADLVTEAKVKTPDIETKARNLSGGNLQKFLMARETRQPLKLLACYNPTWGVDPGSRSAIHHSIMNVAADGAVILLLSEDFDELFELCTHLGALFQGQMSPVLPREEVTVDQLGRWMTGQDMARTA